MEFSAAILKGSYLRKCLDSLILEKGILLLYNVRCVADPRTDSITVPKGLLTHSVASTIKRQLPLYSQGKEAPSHSLKPLSHAISERHELRT